MVGFCEALYLIFGSTCNDWDLKFISWFSESDVTWKQAVILVASVLVVFTLATLLVANIRSASSDKPNRSVELTAPRCSLLMSWIERHAAVEWPGSYRYCGRSCSCGQVIFPGSFRI